MKKFIGNIIYFSIPFIIYILIIRIVDPFNYFGNPSFVQDTLKLMVSSRLEPHLFKLIAYTRNPNSNIALGDSRTNSLCNSRVIKNYTDLSYGGASLNEMIQTFWYASEITKLDTVILGINLNLYNKYNKRFWVEETIERKKNIIAYAFNKYTFKSAILILKIIFFKKQIEIGKPPVSREEFWQFQLGPTAEKFYGQFSLADNYYKELKDISDYCAENNIKLIIWIPPNHIDFQKRVKDFGLENSEVKFKQQLKTLADVYDYDYPSELTKNKKNFKDPMHFTSEIGDIICREILNHKPNYARFSGNTLNK